MEEGDCSLSSSRGDFGARLLGAVINDNWEAAEVVIQENPNWLGAPITKEGGTALHNAASAKRTRFVKQLVKLMAPEQLGLITNEGCTALYFAAQSEIVTIAEVMVKKNRNLPLIFPNGRIQVLPLYAAIKTGNRDMVSYLYSVTPIEDLNSAYCIYLLKATISSDLFDTAHKILDTVGNRASEEKNLVCLLKMLARKPSKIGSTSQPSVWERCLNSWFRGWFCNEAMMQASAHQLVRRLWRQVIDADDINFSSPTHDNMLQHHKQLLVEAAKVGNVEFIIILISSYPSLIWQFDEELCRLLLHFAIKDRQVRIFNLINELGDLKGHLARFYAKEESTMLQLAAELPSIDRLNIIPGAALQMQQELLWFQEIEKIVMKSLSVNEGVTQEEDQPTAPDWAKEEKPTIVQARGTFVKEHDGLQKNGEKWMKDTANSCMLVAALIATVVFPAAFTIPGGNNQETGIPMFLENNWFTVFFVSDAIAMLFSSSSLLVFLSILTSRYTDKDFLISLPRRLVLGLLTLLISIVGMLIAFTAACFLVFKSKTSVPVRFILVAVPVVPICLFVILHCRLWWDIYCSALVYSYGLLFRSQNRLFKQAIS